MREKSLTPPDASTILVQGTLGNSLENGDRGEGMMITKVPVGVRPIRSRQFRECLHVPDSSIGYQFPTEYPKKRLERTRL
jgi:hypothetical protein